MQELRFGEQTIQVQLKTKRNLLFEEFARNPSNTRLAIEIRSIDDRIAELARRMVPDQKAQME